MIGTITGLVRRLKESRHVQGDPIGFARSIGVQVGDSCRLLGMRRSSYGAEPFLVKLGNHVSVTSSQFVTHDGSLWVFREEDPKLEIYAPVVVGNNVFIGYGCVIMPGVIIGDNCVIGAGSVVTRSIPPNTVAAGIPAKPIRSLDDYWERMKDRCLHTRGMPWSEKRPMLIETFRERMNVDTSKDDWL